MRTLVVTGGAKGIGFGVAERFAGEGWHVVVADSDPQASADAAEKLGAEAAVVDVTDRAGLVDACRAAALRTGGIDALVTSAGITRIGPSAELAEDDWRAVVDVDLTGTFLSCQAAAPHLRDGSAVVTIASTAAFRGMPGRAAYCAAKAGVVALTRCLAAEWAPRVRVNSVAPGWVDTPFLRDAARRGHVDLDELAARPPMKRLSDVTDVVGAVRFLVSDEAGFVTGQTLTVDGGWVWAS
ncbi:SDR family NAD(P)-dependent oxidoreductase [Jiangella asiatica]|uniref:SDR family oxidoreductase n=1 Tax=Jiangella asiatica TaxID=2530372 RepID=A0A4R5DAK5_9ACTN|nr:SDR family NAD(P)-dependent oxidoreductase [Jiangella asiatica]TDE09867.1 SDR family oxidoreductase [Jiangella asiatica]